MISKQYAKSKAVVKIKSAKNIFTKVAKFTIQIKVYDVTKVIELVVRKTIATEDTDSHNYSG